MLKWKWLSNDLKSLGRAAFSGLEDTATCPTMYLPSQGVVIISGLAVPVVVPHRPWDENGRSSSETVPIQWWYATNTLPRKVLDAVNIIDSLYHYFLSNETFLHKNTSSSHYVLRELWDASCRMPQLFRQWDAGCPLAGKAVFPVNTFMWQLFVLLVQPFFWSSPPYVTVTHVTDLRASSLSHTWS